MTINNLRKRRLGEHFYPLKDADEEQKGYFLSELEMRIVMKIAGSS